MKIHEAIILTLFDMISYVIVSSALLERKVNLLIQLASIVCFSVIIGTGSYYLTGWTTVFISGFLIIVMLTHLYRKKPIETIYVYLISTIIILAIQFVVLLPLKALFGEIVYSFKVGIVAQSINVALTYAIIGIVPVRHIYQFVSTKNKIFKYLTVNLFLLMLFMLIYWNVNIDGILENLISIVALSLSAIAVNFIFIKNSLKNEQVINKLMVNEQYLPIIDELITDIKTRQHDYKNHIQALSMIIYSSENKQEMVTAFEKYKTEIAYKENLNDFIKYSNKIIAGFLYSKKSQAEIKGIDFSITIKETIFESKLNDYEWIEMLGILIDNAIEAELINNEIKVIIDKEKDMNLIIVKNKHPYLEKEKIKNMFDKGFSKKANSNWGYGLYNLRKIVYRNQGEIEIYNEQDIENYIVFKLLVP